MVPDLAAYSKTGFQQPEKVMTFFVNFPGWESFGSLLEITTVMEFRKS